MKQIGQIGTSFKTNSEWIKKITQFTLQMVAWAQISRPKSEEDLGLKKDRMLLRLFLRIGLKSSQPTRQYMCPIDKS